MNDAKTKADDFVQFLEGCEAGRKLGHVWDLICRAAAIGWLQQDDVDEIIESGLDFCVEELVFEPLPSVGEVRVSLVDDDGVVAGHDLLLALKILRAQMKSLDS